MSDKGGKVSKNQTKCYNKNFHLFKKLKRSWWGFSPMRYVKLGRWWKYCLYMWRKPRQSVNRWRLVSTEEWQCGQVGLSLVRSKCLCINLERLVLKSVRITSTLLVVRMGQISMHGFISLNLFSVCPPHSLCQFCLMIVFIASFTHLNKKPENSKGYELI